MLALALIVCEWESTLTRDTWRRPGDRDRRYLNALIGWGYKPSEVERLILAQPEATGARPEAEPTDADDTQADEVGGEPDDAEPDDAEADDAEADDTEPDDAEADDTEAEPTDICPYQKDGEGWYRYEYPVSGEVRPRGPFASTAEALADAAEVGDV